MIVSSGNFRVFCHLELVLFNSAAEKGHSGSLALFLFPLYRVSMAMIRAESKLQFLSAHCHQAGYQALGIFVFFLFFKAGE